MEVLTVYCMECGTRMKVARENFRDKTLGLPNLTLAGVEVRRCPACGAEEVAIPRIEEMHRVVAGALIRKAGRLDGAEIRFLRKSLGWSGMDFARRFGVAPETISRWEHGAPMDRLAERLLRLAVAREAPVADYRVEDLGFVDAPPAKTFRVRVKPAGKRWIAA
ncbi:MAG: hypothetical protein NTW87_04980 [Planctomycetota bacterium]|nr:hypothetical protein [Planctomycetota bacterium]